MILGFPQEEERDTFHIEIKRLAYILSSDKTAIRTHVYTGFSKAEASKPLCDLRNNDTLVLLGHGTLDPEPRFNGYTAKECLSVIAGLGFNGRVSNLKIYIFGCDCASTASIDSVSFLEAFY